MPRETLNQRVGVKLDGQMQASTSCRLIYYHRIVRVHPKPPLLAIRTATRDPLLWPHRDRRICPVPSTDQFFYHYLINNESHLHTRGSKSQYEAVKPTLRSQSHILADTHIFRHKFPYIATCPQEVVLALNSNRMCTREEIRYSAYAFVKRLSLAPLSFNKTMADVSLTSCENPKQCEASNPRRRALFKAARFTFRGQWFRPLDSGFRTN